VKQIVRSGPNWADVIDLDDWKAPMPDPKFPNGWYKTPSAMRWSEFPAKLLPESVPGPHDWYNPRERLWFCTMNGVQFAVVDSNSDQALAAVDEAFVRWPT
jgi:hypothetical protein